MILKRTFLVVHLATTLLAGPLMAGGQGGRPTSRPPLSEANEAMLEHGAAGLREGIVVDESRRVIEIDGLRLAGGAGADFTVSGGAGNFTVTIGSGGVDYVMQPGCRSVAFATPFGGVTMFPATRGGQSAQAGGNMLVTAETAIFSVSIGILEIVTGQGRQVMSGGRSLVLTNAMGADSASDFAGTAPAGTASAGTASAQAESGPASSKLAIGFGVVSILTAAGVVGVLGSQGDDDSAEEISPH